MELGFSCLVAVVSRLAGRGKREATEEVTVAQLVAPVSSRREQRSKTVGHGDVNDAAFKALLFEAALHGLND